jgi:IclR family acetate operon transcriptional repressor
MQSVLRSLRLLETVSELQPIGVSDLARHEGLPTSTAQRIAVTLAEAGWLRQTNDGSGRWTVTAKALVVGRRAIGEVGLREAASGPMRRLRDITQETINLSAVDGTERLVMIERADSEQAVRTFLPLGGSSPLHASSSGRAVLAAFSDEIVEQTIRRGLEQLTDRTTTDPDALRRKVAETRRRGYAVNIGENRPGVCAIGAAVLSHTGLPLAGLSISMPQSRFSRRRVPEWGDMVIGSAAEISANLRE